ELDRPRRVRRSRGSCRRYPRRLLQALRDELQRLGQSELPRAAQQLRRYTGLHLQQVSGPDGCAPFRRVPEAVTASATMAPAARALTAEGCLSEEGCTLAGPASLWNN